MAFQISAWIVYIPLQVMLIAALWRGAYRQYWSLFVYVVAELLVTLAEIPFFIAAQSHTPDATKFLAKVYYIDDIALDSLIYVLVISLLYQATSQMQPRAIIRSALTAGAIIFAGVSLWVHYDPALKLGEWMTAWTLDLSFCSMCLDLALWMVLLATRAKDKRLLALSGALGVKLAGTAIGEGIQKLADIGYTGHSLTKTSAALISQTGAAVEVLASIACVYFWWRVFKTAAEKKTSPEGAILADARRKS